MFPKRSGEDSLRFFLRIGVYYNDRPALHSEELSAVLHLLFDFPAHFGWHIVILFVHNPVCHLFLHIQLSRRELGRDADMCDHGPRIVIFLQNQQVCITHLISSERILRTVKPFVIAAGIVFARFRQSVFIMHQRLRIIGTLLVEHLYGIVQELPFS